jgi:hypothetical protein
MVACTARDIMDDGHHDQAMSFPSLVARVFA